MVLAPAAFTDPMRSCELVLAAHSAKQCAEVKITLGAPGIISEFQEEDFVVKSEFTMHLVIFAKELPKKGTVFAADAPAGTLLEFAAGHLLVATHVEDTVGGVSGKRGHVLGAGGVGVGPFNEACNRRRRRCRAAVAFIITIIMAVLATT